MQIEATPEEWAIVLQLLDHGVRHIGAALAQIGQSAAGECGQALIIGAVMARRIEQGMAADAEKASASDLPAGEVQ